jgi:O-antigen ligase
MNEELIESTTTNGNTSPSLAARISLSLIGLMAVLPFLQYHHARPIPAFYTEYIAFFLGMLALTLFLAGRYWRNIAIPWIVFAPLGLFAVMLLQMNLGMSAYYEIQIIALLYLIWAVLLVILGAVLRKEFGLTIISVVLAWSFLVGGELSATVAILQHFNIHSFLDSFIAAKNFAAVYGNVGQTNHFATHICLALASLVFLFAAARLPIWVLIPLALPLLLVLSLSGSRSSGIYLFAVLALSLLLYWRGTLCTEGYVAKRRLMITSFLLITGFVLMQWLLVKTSMFVVPTGSITVADRIFDQASGTSVRIYLWQEAWHMFLQAPILGIGTGQFALHHFHLSTVFQNPEITGIYNNAHNLILHLLAETGLVGTLPVVVGIVLWLFGLYSVRRQSLDLSLWWLLAIVGIMGIHSLHEYPLWYGHFLGLAAFLLGAGETRFISMQLPHIGKLVTLSILVLGWGVMATMEQDYRQLESIMPAHDNQQNKLLTSSNRSVLQALHQKTLLSPYVDYSLSSNMELNQEKLDLKLKVNQRVMGFHPSAPVTYKQAVLLALNGENEAAIEQAENAALAYPNELVKFADSLVSLKIEYPKLLERLGDWTNRKIKEKEKEK